MNNRVSIITVTYNAGNLLEKTILSILRQTFKNIDHIVIDGASTDNTLEIIKEYDKYISYWKSEPDKGIYDAMNKGLNAATGDYIWFLNAGDEIYTDSTLEEIFSKSGREYDAYYGNIVYINNKGKNLGERTLKKIPETLSWENIIEGMVVSHQAFIVKRGKAVNYNPEYIHCADIDWLIRTLKNCTLIFNTKLYLAKFLIGGYSKRNIIPSNIERLKIFFKHYSFLKVILTQIKLSFVFIKYFFSSKERYY